MKKIEGLLVTAPEEAHSVHMSCKGSLKWAFDLAVGGVAEGAVRAATVVEKDSGSLGEANLYTGRRATVWVGMVRARWEHLGAGSGL